MRFFTSGNMGGFAIKYQEIIILQELGVRGMPFGDFMGCNSLTNQDDDTATCGNWGIYPPMHGNVNGTRLAFSHS